MINLYATKKNEHLLRLNTQVHFKFTDTSRNAHDCVINVARPHLLFDLFIFVCACVRINCTNYVYIILILIHRIYQFTPALANSDQYHWHSNTYRPERSQSNICKHTPAHKKNAWFLITVWLCINFTKKKKKFIRDTTLIFLFN